MKAKKDRKSVGRRSKAVLRVATRRPIVVPFEDYAHHQHYVRMHLIPNYPDAWAFIDDLAEDLDVSDKAILMLIARDEDGEFLDGENMRVFKSNELLPLKTHHRMSNRGHRMLNRDGVKLVIMKLTRSEPARALRKRFVRQTDFVDDVAEHLNDPVVRQIVILLQAAIQRSTTSSSIQPVGSTRQLCREAERLGHHLCLDPEAAEQVHDLVLRAEKRRARARGRCPNYTKAWFNYRRGLSAQIMKATGKQVRIHGHQRIPLQYQELALDHARRVYGGT